MESAQSLLEKYKPDAAVSTAADVHQKILEMQAPNWAQYPATSAHQSILSALRPGQPAEDNKRMGDEVPKACMAVMAIKDEAAPLQYVLTILYDMLREDSSCFEIFDEGMREGCAVFKPLMGLLERSSTDVNWLYVANTGAWILSATMSHMPRHFTEDEVKSFLSVLMASASGPENVKCCSDLGVLEAITNLLKSAVFREVVWTHQGVADLVFSVDRNTTSQMLYKSAFAIWMASFDPSLTDSLKAHDVVKKLREILAFSRVEKVIRVCLTILKNFLAQKAECRAVCEDIAEEGVLEAVQQLEYEKWRDSELYDDIRELVQLIHSQVKELSNFDRYMKELESGKLSWGFIHSSKFFGENVMKFETGNFKAVELLAKLLCADEDPAKDATTLAVACHDIGEFVSLHPVGKKQVGRFGIKERVMNLMASTEPTYREVRREALLCCQKIMLNKWQDAAGEKK